MCVSGHNQVYEFSVQSEEVGIAWLAWHVSPYTTHQVIYLAALYSHTTGKNKHRDSALPVGSPLCVKGRRALGMEFHRPCLRRL